MKNPCGESRIVSVNPKSRKLALYRLIIPADYRLNKENEPAKRALIEKEKTDMKKRNAAPPPRSRKKRKSDQKRKSFLLVLCHPADPDDGPDHGVFHLQAVFG